MHPIAGVFLGSALLVLGAPAHGGNGDELGRDVAANCANCHGTDGRSRGGFPALAGRNKRELIRLMQDFRSGKRRSTIMQQLARGYSEVEIEAAAAYFAAQPKD